MILAPFVLFAASATFDESFRAGLSALQRNDLSAAQTELESASKQAPGNARVWVALAQTYRKLGDAQKANTAAAKAETLGSKDPAVVNTLAMYFNEAGEPLKALELQARHAELIPQNAAAGDRAEAGYSEMAQSLLQQSKFTESLAVIKAGLIHFKGSAQLQLMLGVAYYGLRRFDEAAAAFLRTIELRPEISQPYVFLGRFLDQIPARLPGITQLFVEFERLDPENAEGYYLHAKALNTQTIEPEAAEKLLKKALSLNGQDASSHFELGVVLDRTRRYEEAASEFERAAELAPNDPATHYRLSRLYDRLGKPVLAQAEREKHVILETAARQAQ